MQNSGTEKYQKKRDHISNVKDKIKEVFLEEDVLIGRIARLFPFDNYLIIGDYTSPDKLIHVFDKNEFNYLTSVAERGQGPNEISNMGHIGIDEINRVFYVNDHGKQKIVSYQLDSILINSEYIPKEKMTMNQSQFPSRYQYINDTLAIGLIIEPIGNSDFRPSVGKLNMNTGEISLMNYQHPEISKKRITFAVSMENSLYVECYVNRDLMSICNLNGELQYNIYGQHWNNKETNQVTHYGEVVFCKDKIVALYTGENNTLPTKFLVFDTNGEYIQTLETGYQIVDFCYDKQNNRLIMIMDDKIQFAYLDLEDLFLP